MDKLIVDSVTKKLNNKYLLSNIYLECTVGDIVCIMGRNGTGKTTLFHIMFSSIFADSKHIRLNNLIVNTPKKVRKFIRFLPQHHFLPSNISVKRLIYLFIEKQNTYHIFQQDWVTPILHQKIKNLSSGTKRLLEVYLICYSNAPFILLDEPFNGLSPINKTRVAQLILNLKNEKGFIITDHSYEEALQLSTKNYILKNGCLKPILNNKQLKAEGYLP